MAPAVPPAGWAVRAAVRAAAGSAPDSLEAVARAPMATVAGAVGARMAVAGEGSAGEARARVSPARERVEPVGVAEVATAKATLAAEGWGAVAMVTVEAATVAVGVRAEARAGAPVDREA